MALPEPPDDGVTVDESDAQAAPSSANVASATSSFRMVPTPWILSG